ncbi:MAG: UDP-N-acetylmuramoyl-L-alanine--D-glutamate ligase [Clostridia bacterium]|nr:UDP-N-acetylmuramoyl-L-alanine--D-glutamate ligase [Clostridia bacterium]
MYRDKKVLIIGLARSGLAAAKLLVTLGASVTVSEAKPASELPDAEALMAMGVKLVGQTGEVFEADYDEVIKNPGISNEKWFVRRLKERGIPVITEIELAYRVAPDQHYIAITGTNGKTTTCTLLYEILKKAYPEKTHLSGNIGVALCDTVLKADLMHSPGHYIVLEISNFQLLDIVTFQPSLAAIINLAPDHIDFMGSEDAYYRSKCRVYENMDAGGVFLKNEDDPLVAEYTARYPVPAQIVGFSAEAPADVWADADAIYAFGEKLMPLKELKIVGRHNVQNVLVAVAAALQMGVPAQTVRQTVAAFTGVEHRIEFVRELGGVRYYNDSKGTNVDATVTALKAFDAPVILLAGGFEKGLSFEPLKPYLKNVKRVVAFGACGERLNRELTGNTGVLTETLAEALKAANEIAVPGDVILLSPTTSSFDQFSCYEERGEKFKEMVRKLG